MTDIALKQFDGGDFDIDIVDGDLLADNGMRTDVLISLFSDRIAESDDVIPDDTDNRRGYWADAYRNNKTGSRLWLLSRAKQTDEILNLAEEYANEALQHLIDDGVASSVSNAASWLENGFMCLQTIIKKGDSSLFEDTFNFSLQAL